MPRFFFDTDDGSVSFRDPDGIVLPNHEHARRLAQAALPDMAHDTLPDGEQRNYSVHVRDEDDVIIYSVNLALSGRWHT